MKQISEQERRAHIYAERVYCPSCGANPGYVCFDRTRWAACSPHKERFQRAAALASPNVKGDVP